MYIEILEPLIENMV